MRNQQLTCLLGFGRGPVLNNACHARPSPSSPVRTYDAASSLHSSANRAHQFSATTLCSSHKRDSEVLGHNVFDRAEFTRNVYWQVALPPRNSTYNSETVMYFPQVDMKRTFRISDQCAAPSPVIETASTPGVARKAVQAGTGTSPASHSER